MLKKIGVDACVAETPETVVAADKLILPGVGAFDHGMQHLNQSGMRDVLEQRVIRDRVPILGICLGMQLLTCGSEEGKIPGLGWIDASTRKFQSAELGPGLRIPHMGWNLVSAAPDCALFRELLEDPRFYFVHSYYVECSNAADSSATTTYGHEFTSSVHAGNIYGVQFHPEKSHRFGMQLLRNFAALAT